MSRAKNGIHKFRGIAFVGNYLPRKCGIATFTHDLAEAVAEETGGMQSVSVCAMNDIEAGYDYPDRVKFEVRQDYPMDYARAADFLNFSRIDVVSLQHEFGIFGGVAGANILMLLKELRWPIVVTCHTVLEQPKPAEKALFLDITSMARKVVVMSEKAVSFLETIYGIPAEKIAHIPHGIHDTSFVDPSYYKDKFGVEGRKVLITFGLINRNKGIETVIEALPEVVRRHPKTTYLVLGATHPAVIRSEGESYRLSLQRRVRELNLGEHVLFHPRFVPQDELLEYLGASDILVTPYRNMDQITSGALSYAMGAGKAVISTPYWHAEELLAEERGRFFPVGDAAELARQINRLLDDEVSLSAMRKRAYLHCRHMIWPKVARRYLDLFDEVRSRMATTLPVASAMRRPISASSIPTPKLDHLLRLSDDTGPSHHALRGMPNWTYGYWLEDACTALVASAKFHDIFGTDVAAQLIERNLRLIHYMLSAAERPIGRINYARVPMREATETEIGKAAWALGYAISHGSSIATSSANDIFNRIVPAMSFTGMQAMAYAILGAANYLTRFPGASAIRRYLASYAEPLARSCAQTGWIDRWEGSDWGVAVQALSVASEMLNDTALSEQVRGLGDVLREATCDGTVFLKRGDNPDEEELPTLSLTFIEALGAIFNRERDVKLLGPVRAAADWFLGANRRNEALYDFKSGGCYDALTARGVNQNQGTVATVSCLISFLTLLELAGTDRTDLV